VLVSYRGPVISPDVNVVYKVQMRILIITHDITMLA
jgi:hypothetical protein